MPGGAHTKEAENTFLLMEGDFKCLIVYNILYLTSVLSLADNDETERSCSNCCCRTTPLPCCLWAARQWRTCWTHRRNSWLSWTSQTPSIDTGFLLQLNTSTQKVGYQDETSRLFKGTVHQKDDEVHKQRFVGVLRDLYLSYIYSYIAKLFIRTSTFTYRSSTKIWCSWMHSNMAFYILSHVTHVNVFNYIVIMCCHVCFVCFSCRW